MRPERFWLFVFLFPPCFSISSSISDSSVSFWGFFSSLFNSSIMPSASNFSFDLVLGYLHCSPMLPYFYLHFIQMGVHHFKFVQCSHLKSVCTHEEEPNLFFWRCGWLQPWSRANGMFAVSTIGSGSTWRDSLSVPGRYCFFLTYSAVPDLYFVLFARQKRCI